MDILIITTSNVPIFGVESVILSLLLLAVWQANVRTSVHKNIISMIYSSTALVRTYVQTKTWYKIMLTEILNDQRDLVFKKRFLSSPPNYSNL